MQENDDSLLNVRAARLSDPLSVYRRWPRPRARRTGSGTFGAGRRASTLRVAQHATQRALAAATAAAAAAVG